MSSVVFLSGAEYESFRFAPGEKRQRIARFDLRAYQLAACDAAEEAWKSSREALVVMATGLGKTSVCSELMKRAKGRCLLLCHLEELLQNARGTIEALTGEQVGVERGKERNLGERLIVGTMQTVGRRLQKLPSNAFEVIVVDEVHHVGSKLYQAILAHFSSAKVVGLTATPVPGMGMGKAVYSYGIRSGIEDGYLVPIEGRKVLVEAIHLSRVKRGDSGEDFHQEELDEEMQKAASAIADVIVKLPATDRGILFFPGCKSAQLVSELIEVRAPGSAVYVDGTIRGEERRELIGRLRSGDARWLCNVGIACLDSETEILTRRGWVGHQDITSDDLIANWSTDGRVAFNRPLAIEVRPRRADESMHSILQKQMSMRITGDHRVVHESNGDWKVTRANECRGALEVPICGEEAPLQLSVPPEAHGDVRLRTNSLAYVYRKKGMPDEEARSLASDRISKRDAMRFAQPSELTDQECWFIGFWLGDGNVSELKSGGKEFYIHNEKALTRQNGWLESLMDSIGVDSVKKSRGSTWQWSIGRGTGFGSQERRGLYRLEPYLVKDGSEFLWGLTRSQVRLIMEGFWMADGEHGDNLPRSGAFRVSNSNRKLLDFLQALLVCRGMSCRVYWSGALGRLTVSNRTTHKAGELHGLTQEPEHRDETVWCVKSDTSFIIARRNGKVFVTGNTEGFDWPAANVIGMCCPTLSRTAYIQRGGRGTRPLPGVCVAATAAERKAAIAASGKPRMTILDFCGASDKVSLITHEVLETDELPRVEPEDDGAGAGTSEAGTGDDYPETVSRASGPERDRVRRVARGTESRTVFATADFDPFEEAGTGGKQSAIRVQSPADGAASPKQTALLKKYGVECYGITRAQAGKMISYISLKGWRLSGADGPILDKIRRKNG